MKNEIERKFFVKDLPDLRSITPLHYERYFLTRKDGVEERIQKVDNTYTYEKKVEVSNLERTREKKEITEEEFNAFKTQAGKAIVRDRYNISSNPDIAIQIYHGRFEGLIRAEVEFNTVEEAEAFEPLDWMGKEMTGLPIARDAELLELDEKEFKKHINR